MKEKLGSMSCQAIIDVERANRRIITLLDSAQAIFYILYIKRWRMRRHHFLYSQKESILGKKLLEGFIPAFFRFLSILHFLFSDRKFQKIWFCFLNKFWWVRKNMRHIIFHIMLPIYVGWTWRIFDESRWEHISYYATIHYSSCTYAREKYFSGLIILKYEVFLHVIYRNSSSLAAVKDI